MNFAARSIFRTSRLAPPGKSRTAATFHARRASVRLLDTVVNSEMLNDDVRLPIPN